MPRTVRLYACRQHDATTGMWSKSRYRYSLEEIAGMANAEAIMDNWEDATLPDADDRDAYSTGQLMRGITPPNR